MKKRAPQPLDWIRFAEPVHLEGRVIRICQVSSFYSPRGTQMLWHGVGTLCCVPGWKKLKYEFVEQPKF